MNKIKAIIFDYGGTLSESGMRWDDYKTATKNLLGKHGYPRETSQIYEAIMDTIEYRLKVRREERKELTPHEFFTHVLKLLEIPSKDAVLEEMINDFHQYYTAVFPACLPHLLEDLSRSYKIALLSNTWIDGPRKMLERQGFSKWFDVMICSCDKGIPKPDPRIFHYTLQQIGVKANKAVMVGDSIEADMRGAESVGIKPVWVESSSEERWGGYKIKSVCELPGIIEKIQEST